MFTFLFLNQLKLTTKIHLLSKTKQTLIPMQMCSDCNTSVYWELRLLTGPNWATLVAGREFLLDRNILYLRPSSLDGMIFMPSRFGSQLQQQTHTCSCFRVPAAKASLGAHLNPRSQPFFPAALWKHSCWHWPKLVPQILCLLNIFSIRRSRRVKRTAQVFSVNCRCFLI